MTAARFPAHRDLAGFEFAQSRVDEALVRRLHTLEFRKRPVIPVIAGIAG
jgi:hypothetical protein